MQRSSNDTVVKGLAGLAIIFLTLLPSAAYLFAEYTTSVERLADDARVQAFVVSKVVSLNPEGWRYAAERIAAAITEVSDAQSHSAVVDQAGQELVSVGLEEAPFRIYRSVAFHDFGVEAGSVVVSSSLQHELMVSAMLAGAGVLMAYVLLKLLYKKVLDPLDLAQGRLRQSSAKLRISAIAFDAAEGLLITDANSVILQVNQAYASATGYTVQEIVGQTPKMFNSGRQPQAFFAQMWESIHASGTWKGEILNRRKNGKIYPAWLTITAVRADDGSVSHYVGTHADISERKAAELARVKFNTELESLVKQLTLAKNDAEAANRSKSEFLGSMSHELRTPLNAVLGFSQLLGMDPRLDADAKEQVREIEQAGQHLLALVNDLIDLARIESGRLEVVLESVPVSLVMVECLSMVAPIARQYRIELMEVSVGDDLGMTVRVDYVRLRQVLINLLSNAIKYNRTGGSVSLSCQLDGATVRISVRDTGPGIPQDMQVRLFTAFDRLGAECSKVEGTGIGLVITRRLVEGMGGTIGFESIEGQGSTFWISFPVEKPP
jgi:PAS domain S-box-containing protein